MHSCEIHDLQNYFVVIAILAISPKVDYTNQEDGYFTAFPKTSIVNAKTMNSRCAYHHIMRVFYVEFPKFATVSHLLFSTLNVASDLS